MFAMSIRFTFSFSDNFLVISTQFSPISARQVYLIQINLSGIKEWLSDTF